MALQGTFDYRYPLGHVHNRLFFLMQHDSKSSLCSIKDFTKFNTNQIIQEISYLYNPYFVGMVPSKRGFHFVDIDIFHIDDLREREPHALELDEPLDNFGLTHWLNEYICYVAAKKKQQSGVWLINTINGSTQQVYASIPSEQLLLFPSIVNNLDEHCLFVFEQSTINNDKNISYNQKLFMVSVTCEQKIKKDTSFNLEELLSQIFEKKCNQIQPIKELYTCHNYDKPLIDFFMHTVDFGHFVILEGYKKDEITFSVNKIYRQDNFFWQQEFLFLFSLPRKYLLGGSKEIYHFSTLLPRLINDSFYFVNNKDHVMKLHRYDINKRSIKEVDTPNCFIEDCVPNVIENKIHFGGIIKNHQ
jgi:hypothetical protein